MRRIVGSPQRRVMLPLALLTAVYFASGRLGLSFAFVNESASAVWPPTGIAIATLLMCGMRAWPAVAVGAFLVNLSTSGVVVSSAVIAAGNALEGIGSAWLARRFACGLAAFDRTPDILRFPMAAIGGSTIAASVGVSALVVVGLAASSDAPSVWFTWWLGDAVGAIVVTPLIILWTRPSGVVWTHRRRAEAIALVACVFVVPVLLFGISSAGVSHYPLEFLVIPVLVWSAFRFGARETAGAAAIVAAIAIYGTLHGFGPFVRRSPHESL